MHEIVLDFYLIELGIVVLFFLILLTCLFNQIGNGFLLIPVRSTIRTSIGLSKLLIAARATSIRRKFPFGYTGMLFIGLSWRTHSTVLVQISLLTIANMRQTHSSALYSS